MGSSTQYKHQSPKNKHQPLTKRWFCLVFAMITLVSFLCLHFIFSHCQYQGPLFQCSGPGSRYLPSHVRCDGYPDCPGGEDEAGCGQQQRQQYLPPQPPPNRGYYYPQPQVYGYNYQPFKPNIPSECMSAPPAHGTGHCPLFWLQPTTRWSAWEGFRIISQKDSFQVLQCWLWKLLPVLLFLWPGF